MDCMTEQDDTQPIWARLTGESNAWFHRFLLYRNMSAVERSLLGAYNIYQLRANKSRGKPYSDVSGAWKEAFAKYDWKFRAEQHDAHLQAEQEERQRILFEFEQQEIERILTSDYATMHRRIEALAKMAHTIEASFNDPETQEVNPKWLYPDKIREWRGCLDDIAKELGQRIKKQEVTGKDGGAIEYLVDWGGGAIESENEE